MLAMVPIKVHRGRLKSDAQSGRDKVLELQIRPFKPMP